VAKLAGLKPGIRHEKIRLFSRRKFRWRTIQPLETRKWGVGEYHKGDIGNFTADANGNGTITLTTDEWNIGSGDPTKDILGKGLIVHEGTDDFVSQPSGNGARVASAIIK
jgi:Cu-Zn family superoxide dismutase